MEDTFKSMWIYTVVLLHVQLRPSGEISLPWLCSASGIMIRSHRALGRCCSTKPIKDHPLSPPFVHPRQSSSFQLGFPKSRSVNNSRQPGTVYSPSAPTQCVKKTRGCAAPWCAGVALVPQQPWMSERSSQDSQNRRALQVATGRVRTCCTLGVVKWASRMGLWGCCPAHSKFVLFPALLFCKPCTSPAEHPVSQRSGCHHQRQFRQAQSQCFRLFPVSQQLLCVIMARAYSGKALLPFLPPASWNVEGNQPLSQVEEKVQSDYKRCPGTQSISLPPALFALSHLHVCTHPRGNKSRDLHITGLLYVPAAWKKEEFGVLWTTAFILVKFFRPKSIIFVFT